MDKASFHGRFVWYDLLTTDPEAALDFYTKAIGWGTEEWQGPMPYTMITAGGNPIGGVMDLPEEAAAAGAPPHWISYVGATDCETSV
jgi:predicted enzyme related to lactoylglutathione lyase